MILLTAWTVGGYLGEMNFFYYKLLIKKFNFLDIIYALDFAVSHTINVI